MSTSSSSDQHLAAISEVKGTPLKIELRQTPTPGPGELLIQVKSVAVNPIDYYQRDTGFPPLKHYPAVLGSDIGGVVLKVGASVAEDAVAPGTRVTAFAPCFFMQGDPDYGALQERVLVPAVNAVSIPQDMSFNEASLLPMAVVTTWAGWRSISLPRDTSLSASDKQGMLIWGAAGSVGSMAVQVAKLMGFTVFATASGKHHEYVKRLGATRVFDYKSEGVVESIVKAAKEDGLTLKTGYDCVGSLQPCVDVLKEFTSEGRAKLATVKHVSKDSPRADGVEPIFAAAPTDVEARNEHFHFIFNVWLKERLEKGEVVPSPKVKVVDGGLESVNKALDELRSGVSGTKLVLEL